MADNLYPRFALGPVETALSDTPVTVIQDTRQVGKSTLTEMVASRRDSLVVTLDDPLELAAAREDPVAFVDRYRDGVLIINEAQRAPALIVPLKANVPQGQGRR